MCKAAFALLWFLLLLSRSTWPPHGRPRPKPRLQGTGITGEGRYEAKIRTRGLWCDGCLSHIRLSINRQGTDADLAERRGAVQRRSRLQPDAGAVRRAGEE